MAEEHPARALTDKRPIIFTAQSAFTSFMKHHICRYVFERGGVPVNPFMVFEYFLLDSVPRNDIRRGNNTLLGAADELWTFGTIADGVYEEIRLARQWGKPIRHFSLGKDMESIGELALAQLEYEAGVATITEQSP